MPVSNALFKLLKESKEKKKVRFTLFGGTSVEEAKQSSKLRNRESGALVQGNGNRISDDG